MPPSPDPGRGPSGTALTAVLVLSLLLPAWWMLGPGSRPPPAEDAGVLAFADTVETHLRPASAGPGAEGDPPAGDVGRPARDPFRFGGAAPRAAGGPGPSAPADEGGAERWRVSAILSVNDERVAIVNDVSVREGDRLPDGAQVQSIEARRVILRGPGGERIVLDF